jgi:hypothetical protein
MSDNSNRSDAPLRRADVLSVGPYEKRFIGVTFLTQVISGLTVIALIAAIASLPTANVPIDLNIIGYLVAFFVLWSCAIAYMWRAVIFVLALLFSLLLVIAALAMAGVYLHQYTRNLDDPTVALIAGTLGLAILPILFALTVILDGYRLARTPAEMRELYVTIDRRSGAMPQVLAAMGGIHPICRWLPRNRRLASSVLFVLAAIVGGFSIGFVLLASIMSGPVYAIVSGGIAGGILAAVTALFRYAARRSARVSAENLTQTDQRAPVLFLRSFKDDQVELDRPKRGFVRGFLGMGAGAPSLDHVLLEEFTAVGPVVAIGVPGEAAPFGAARTYVDDSEWKAVVAKFASDAAAVVIVIDDTEGVNWELSHLLDSGHLPKTLCLMPPRYVRQSEKAAEIVRRVLVEQKCTLAEPLTEPCLGWYQLPQGQLLLLVAPRPSQANYVCALRLFRQRWGRQVASAR